MGTAVIFLDDELVNYDILKTTAEQYVTEDATLIGITSNPTNETVVVEKNVNPLVELLNLQHVAKKYDKLVFVVAPHQYAFLKNGVKKFLGTKIPTVFEYAPASQKPFYAEATRQYVDALMTIIQELDTVPDGSVNRIKTVLGVQ